MNLQLRMKIHGAGVQLTPMNSYKADEEDGRRQDCSVTGRRIITRRHVGYRTARSSFVLTRIHDADIQCSPNCYWDEFGFYLTRADTDDFKGQFYDQQT